MNTFKVGDIVILNDDDKIRFTIDIVEDNLIKLKGWPYFCDYKHFTLDEESMNQETIKKLLGIADE